MHDCVYVFRFLCFILVIYSINILVLVVYSMYDFVLNK